MLYEEWNCSQEQFIAEEHQRLIAPLSDNSQITTLFPTKIWNGWNPRVDQVFPTLTAAQIARVAAHGQVRDVQPGKVLVEAGDQVVPFLVVTAGQVDMVQPYGPTETLVAVHRPRP